MRRDRVASCGLKVDVRLQKLARSARTREKRAMDRLGGKGYVDTADAC
jgi:hypothetical protein